MENKKSGIWNNFALLLNRYLLSIHIQLGDNNCVSMNIHFILLFLLTHTEVTVLIMRSLIGFCSLLYLVSPQGDHECCHDNSNPTPVPLQPSSSRAGRRRGRGWQCRGWRCTAPPTTPRASCPACPATGAATR